MNEIIIELIIILVLLPVSVVFSYLQGKEDGVDKCLKNSEDQIMPGMADKLLNIIANDYPEEDSYFDEIEKTFVKEQWKNKGYIFNGKEDL